jgi:LEA14-like dessication related protein
MKQIAWPRLLALLLFAGLPWACKRPEAPVYQDMQNFRLEHPGWKESVVSADVRYYNPNPYKLQFRRAELSVSINNHFVGKSVLDTLIEIPKRDTFSIPVSLKVNTKDVFANALEVVLLHEAQIKLDGFARLGKAGIYINVPIHYEGRQRVDVSLN